MYTKLVTAAFAYLQIASGLRLLKSGKLAQISCRTNPRGGARLVRLQQRATYVRPCEALVEDNATAVLSIS